MKTVTKILAVIIAAMCVISCFAGCEKVVEETEAVQGAVVQESVQGIMQESPPNVANIQESFAGAVLH